MGIVLYELLTGERLFVGESDFSTLEKVRNVEILPPSTYNKRIPRELEPVVLRALSRDVDQRYQTAGEFGSDLQRFLITQEKVFGPSDLAAYMHTTFAEELAKEKVKAAELAAGSGRRSSTSAVRSSGSGPRSSSAPGAGGLPVRASSSGPRGTTSDPGGVSRNAPTSLRSSPSNPGAVNRSAPTYIRSSPSGEAPGWDGKADTVTAAASPPVLSRRANSPPPLRQPPPLEPPTDTAQRPIPLYEDLSLSDISRPRRTAPWVVSLIAGLAGAAVVAGIALVVVLLKGPGAGLLVIHAVPSNASIIVDHVPHGSGPAALKLPAGSHQVDVQANGFVPFHETVVVPAGGQQIVQAELKPAASPPR